MARATPSPAPRSWRDQAARKGRPSSEEPPWRREPQRPPLPPGTRSRRIQTAIAFALFFVFCALLLWLITWLLRPKPVRLVLIGAGYEENLAIPPNPYGRHMLRGLVGLAREGPTSGFLRYDGAEPVDLRSGSAWDRSLNPNADEGTLLLVLGLHGGSDDKGAYVSPQDAGPGEEVVHRVRLEAILSKLASLPKEKNKVLVVDANQLSANEVLGQLHNDFARGLDRLEEQVRETINLAVLSAADADQRSWPCEEWRTTAFGHYLVLGLAGAADPDGDGKITLWDLYSYVSEKVSHWASVNRGAVQTPVLLPRGAEGERRARAITVGFLARGAVAPVEEEIAAFRPPADLRTAWERHQRLDSQNPHPAVFTPHAWSRYQRWLLRYEQHLRAGDSAGAAIVARKITETDAEMERGRKIELGASLGASFAMPAAAGFLEREPDAALRKKFEEFWASSRGEFPKRWVEWGQVAPPILGETSPRLAFQELLLERVAVTPSRDLDQANALLRIADDPTRPRPAESQFLAAMGAHLPSADRRAPDDLLAFALRVRRLAERAALASRRGSVGHAEQLLPWVAAKNRLADTKRLDGEDLLFGTASSDWGRARVLLREAEQAYEEVLADAEALRSACVTRDRALAVLPHHARWHAERRPAEDARQDEDRLRQLEDLWRETHRLVRLLEQPGASGPVVEAATAVNRGLTVLTTQFTEATKPLAAPSPPAKVALTDVWRDADVALLVPFFDPETRSRVLATLRRTSRRLLLDVTASATTSVPTAEETRSAMQNAAARRGRLALAHLGRRDFDALTRDERWDYRLTRQRIEEAGLQDQSTDAVTRAGDEIGRHLRQVVPEVRRLLTPNETDLARLHLDLQSADRLARLASPGVTFLSGEDPSGAYRRLLMQDLLLSQARRALASQWLAEDPRSEPYYRLSGGAFLADVRRLTPVEALRREVEDLRKRLAVDTEVRFVDPVRAVALTSEDGTLIRYELLTKSDPLSPPGHVILWANDTSGMRLAGAAYGTRAARKGTGDRPLELEILRPLSADPNTEPPANPGARTLTLKLLGFYRGRLLEFPTKVELYNRPDVTIRSRTPPRDASLTVRAVPEALARFGYGEGGVAIVLDCSGSMAAPEGRAAEESRYRQAVKALEAVLSRLPRETQVSVWVFGDAADPVKRSEEPERSIRRLFAPARWEPTNAGQFKELMTRLNALDPFNESPLLRAVLEARQDVIGVRGYKTVVLVSDGVDNRWEKDAEANPKKQNVAAAIRERFTGSEVVFNAVGFPPRGPDETRSRDIIKNVIETLSTPGKYWTVNDAGELAGALERAMKPHLRVQIEGRGVEAGLDVSPPGGVDRWFPGNLAAGSYVLRAQVGRAPDAPSARLRLNPGDLLMVNLAASSRGLQFRRQLLAPDFAGRPVRPSDRADWQLAVLQNGRTVKGGLQMLVALEKTLVGEETDLQVPRPREIWMEVGTDLEVSAPAAITWEPESGYAAPVWTVQAPKWPTYSASESPARPQLRVWWDPDQPARAHVQLPVAPLLTAGRSRHTLGSDAVELESVTIERRVVEVRPGVKEPRTCLVVRQLYPRDRPSIARLEGVELDGHEHQIFKDAMRSTSLFWPVRGTPEELAAARLGLISVEEFKKTARAIEMTDLKPPDPADVKPRAAVELK